MQKHGVMGDTHYEVMGFNHFILSVQECNDHHLHVTKKEAMVPVDVSYIHG